MSVRIAQWVDHVLGSLLNLLLRPLSYILGSILNRNHDLVLKNELAIIKILGGGSLIIALPALRALRSEYPNTKFSLITSKEVKEFAELLDVFDEIIVIRYNSPFPALIDTIKVIVRFWRVDTVIDFEIHSKLTTILCSLLAARNRIGCHMSANPWQKGQMSHLFYYNNTSSPIYLNYNQIAIALGATDIDIESTSQKFIETSGIGKKRIGSTDFLVVIAPFCSDLSQLRKFKPKHWSAILQRAEIPENATIAIAGAKRDFKGAEEIRNFISADFPDAEVKNIAGKYSLLESCEIINTSDLFVTIDSGLNHIARLLKVKQIISYWGPTDPSTLLAPISGLNETIVYKKLFCSPCIHVIDPPPCKGHNICMDQYVDDSDKRSSDGWIIVCDKKFPVRI